ncbi:uncharacterized protein LOC126823748 [Patella vulgata]|uniref:uncharacterized protein LOC126823748 n=1 Tax=Patella vulgata TaxID=6465 RepID=UPI00218026EC|nr:uncharacterized protein LOC126823748 [Patella vulgata]
MGVNSQQFQLGLLIVTLVVDVADIICDWLFFVHIYYLEPGLVYGPPKQAVIWALLAMAVIGSIFLIFEMANSCHGICSGQAWVCTDCVSLATVWFADLPQLILSLIIAACREDPVSIFQLSKASVVLLAMLIRLLLYFVRYCNKESFKEASKHNPARASVVKIRLVIFLGLLLNILASVQIFLFTQTNLTDNGISISTPSSAFDHEFDNDRYFKNVSILFHHPTFIYNGQNSNDNFMRLIKINNLLYNPDKKYFFNYEYQSTSTDLKMVIWKTTDSEPWQPMECYMINKTTKQITVGTNCAFFIIGPYTESIFFAFEFDAPHGLFAKQLIGDIKYNAKVNNNIECKTLQNIKESMGSDVSLAVHYYRTTLSDVNHLIQVSGQATFYGTKNLTDIKTVWKTGWCNCESTGALAPHQDTSVITPCSRS